MIPCSVLLIFGSSLLVFFLHECTRSLVYRWFRRLRLLFFVTSVFHVDNFFSRLSCFLIGSRRCLRFCTRYSILQFIFFRLLSGSISDRIFSSFWIGSSEPIGSALPLFVEMLEYRWTKALGFSCLGQFLVCFRSKGFNFSVSGVNSHFL